MADQLRLDVIWARHEDGHGIPDDHPQFVAAFPAGLGENMPELYREWAKAACDAYRDEVDSPVLAFYESQASIDRLDSFASRAVDLIEDEVINPDWETTLADLHAEPEEKGQADA